MCTNSNNFKDCQLLFNILKTQILPYVTATTSDVVRGLVTAKNNNGTETSIAIINVSPCRILIRYLAET